MHSKHADSYITLGEEVLVGGVKTYPQFGQYQSEEKPTGDLITASQSPL